MKKNTALFNPSLRDTALGALALGGLLSAQSGWAYEHHQRIGSVFVIAMENHNFTQPATQTSPQPIFANPAAPFLNSLITPGHPNAAQVSFALNYVNAGMGVHPSEPNYVWAEAGSDFAAHTDADPAASNGNTFYDNTPQIVSQLTAAGSTLSFWHFNDTPHLTAQMNAAGVSWKNYQEDVELSASPKKSASGNDGPVNAFNGTTQYNYAVKHNPMAFFADTALQNVYPLAQLFDDLKNNSVGQYNWITPDQFNDAHSTLSGGFTYQGIHYTGDSANIAQGDNFLAQIIPQLMASPAYQDNGVIIIWWDESEGGDDLSRTIPEIVISPLAKGNAYASSLTLSHSSDIRTMEEIFRLPLINNPIPAAETNNFNGYNNVASVSDLSDLFVPGAVPAAPSLTVSGGPFIALANHHRAQQVQVTNSGQEPVAAPLWLALDNLSAGVTLLNAGGTTAVLAPLGSPLVNVPLGDDGVLRPHETQTVRLEFLDPADAAVSYTSRVLNVTPAP